MMLHDLLVKYSYTLVCFEFITYAFLSACVVASLVEYNKNLMLNLNSFLKFMLILLVSIFSVFTLLFFYFMVDGVILYVLLMLKFLLKVNFVILDLYFSFMYHMVVVVKLVFFWYKHYSVQNEILLFYLKYFFMLFIVLYIYVFHYK